MNKYQNAKIYKIISNIHPLPYYGSTVYSLKRRLQQHEAAYRKNRYCSCHLLFDIGDYQIQLVENFACNNRKELQKREQYFIDKYPCINKRRASLNHQDYKEYVKQYREKNKQYFKQYREKHKAQLKIYYKQYSKQYYAKNKAKLKQKFNCKCGGKYTNVNKARHMRSEKHKRYLIATV